MRGVTHMLAGMTAGSIITWVATRDPQVTLGAVLAGAAGGLLPDVDEPGSFLGRRLAFLERAGGGAFAGVFLVWLFGIVTNDPAILLLPPIGAGVGLAGGLFALAGWSAAGLIGVLLLFLVPSIGYTAVLVSLAVVGLFLAAMRYGPFHSAISTGVQRLTGGHRGTTHALLALGIVLIPSAAVAVLTGSVAWLSLPLGYGLHLLFDAFNPAGVPWLAPWNTTRFAWGRMQVGGVAESIFIRPILLLIILAVAWTSMLPSSQAVGFVLIPPIQTMIPTAGATVPADFTLPPATQLRPTPTPRPSPEPSPPGRQAVVTKTTDLALRKAPGLDQPKIGSLPRGTVVEVIEGPVETQGKEGIIPWWHVRAGSLEGWVSGHYLEWK